MVYFLKKIGMWMDLKGKRVSKDTLEAIAQDSINLRNYTFHPKVANFEEVNFLLKKSYNRNELVAKINNVRKQIREERLLLL